MIFHFPFDISHSSLIIYPYLAIVDLLMAADDLTWKHESNVEWRSVSGERQDRYC